jgi:hypothetical protein
MKWDSWAHRFPIRDRHVFILWFLAIIFALRVAGQALQYWAPQSFLPPFESFQGSRLPYWALLSTQVLILAAMLRASWLIRVGRMIPNLRTGTVLAWCGSLYLAGSMARIVVGLMIQQAPPWFKAWTPAAFHLVLAGFVLTLSSYHRRRTLPS